MNKLKEIILYFLLAFLVALIIIQYSENRALKNEIELQDNKDLIYEQEINGTQSILNMGQYTHIINGEKNEITGMYIIDDNKVICLFPDDVFLIIHSDVNNPCIVEGYYTWEDGNLSFQSVYSNLFYYSYSDVQKNEDGLLVHGELWRRCEATATFP